MSLKKLSALTLTALVLAACSSTGSENHEGHEHHQGHNAHHEHKGHEHSHEHAHERPAEHHQDGTSHAFRCENGLAPVVQISGDDLIVKLDGQQAKMAQTAAASGELFVAQQGLNGKRTEWHQKGQEAYFEFTDAKGKMVQTSCSH